jgi:hypothetical protein
MLSDGGSMERLLWAASATSQTRMIRRGVLPVNVKLAVATAIVAAVHHASGGFLLLATAFVTTRRPTPSQRTMHANLNRKSKLRALIFTEPFVTISACTAILLYFAP